jgi:hypothetical protein
MTTSRITFFFIETSVYLTEYKKDRTAMAPVVGLDQISYKSKRTNAKRVFVPDFDADYNKTNFEQLTNKNSY